MNSKNDDIIYQENDVQISKQEFETLKDNTCVGDMIIHFHFRCQEKKYSKKKNYFHMFMPCTVQFMQTYPLEMTKPSFSDLNLFNYQYVFFPLSDFCVDTLSATHWSLLYIDNTNGQMQFKHFDSMRHSNIVPAHNFVEKLKDIFGLQKLTIEELKCKSQGNSYDCGVYVMAYVDALLQCQNHEEANNQLTPSLIKRYRQYLRKYILECSKIQKS